MITDRNMYTLVQTQLMNYNNNRL